MDNLEGLTEERRREAEEKGIYAKAIALGFCERTFTTGFLRHKILKVEPSDPGLDFLSPPSAFYADRHTVRISYGNDLVFEENPMGVQIYHPDGEWETHLEEMYLSLDSPSVD